MDIIQKYINQESSNFENFCQKINSTPLRENLHQICLMKGFVCGGLYEIQEITGKTPVRFSKIHKKYIILGKYEFDDFLIDAIDNCRNEKSKIQNKSSIIWISGILNKIEIYLELAKTSEQSLLCEDIQDDLKKIFQ